LAFGSTAKRRLGAEDVRQRSRGQKTHPALAACREACVTQLRRAPILHLADIVICGRPACGVEALGPNR
jgi:hypothetical protein